MNLKASEPFPELLLHYRGVVSRVKLEYSASVRSAYLQRDNVRGALDTIDKNEEFIKMTLAVMMIPV
ncbi:hypothetical protein [Pseudomonas sp. PLMAX]|uniref:hypothetical protein n=1 Tax=Pseudomonas sp. PLMAX TaxID=2201998 RepID=UPI0038BDE8F5